jgi:hypothetical protein
MRLTLGTKGEGITLDHPPYNTEGLTCCCLGNKGSGKSNTMAVMAEEMHRNEIPFIFYDPNGDALSLAELGEDVVTIGNPAHDEKIRQADYPLAAVLDDLKGFVRMVLEDGYSLVVDLSAGKTEDQAIGALNWLLRTHYNLAAKERTPVGVFVDEAQLFAPQSGASGLEIEARKTMRKVSFDGRKRGMMFTVATQRVTYLDKALVFGCNIRIFGKVTYWPDYEAIKHYVPATFHQMREMRSGKVHLVTEKAQGIVQIKRRTTTDLGQTPAFTRRKKKIRPSKVQQLQINLPQTREANL